MLNQSHCKLNTLKFQSHLLNWYKFIQPLYQKYVPSSIRNTLFYNIIYERI
ncbi:MAG: hypothetical protein ACLT6X_00380 [Megamonas funiformis]|uniref:hypothetical protein n=1 Tax=Megamonas funiformis TaxID=437897 RepID=UPI0039960F3D